MTTLDSFRRGIAPKASDKEVRDLLWCCTPYPFSGDLRKLRRSIRKHLRAGGGSVEGAINHAHAELDREMTEWRARQALGGGHD